jgi:hypothetical protein
MSSPGTAEQGGDLPGGVYRLRQQLTDDPLGGPGPRLHRDVEPRDDPIPDSGRYYLKVIFIQRENEPAMTDWLGLGGRPSLVTGAGALLV